MNSFERLEDEACKDGIDVITRDFKSPRIKGLYCNNTIGINNAVDTSVEKSCILAEELGHHYTSFGDITDLDDMRSKKQERQARLWGYNKRIGLSGIIQAYEAGCQNCHEIAEELGVTEEFLYECIACYRDKYGTYVTHGNYIVYFIPNLTVMKKI